MSTKAKNSPLKSRSKVSPAAVVVMLGILAIVAVAVKLLTHAATAPLTVYSTDDAFVTSAEPTRTSGNSNRLFAGYGYCPNCVIVFQNPAGIYKSYMRFEVYDAPTVVTKATLRLYRQFSYKSVGYPQLFLVPDNRWNENSINYLNAPNTSTLLNGSPTVTASGQYAQYDYDVTNIVKANGFYSFALLKDTSVIPGDATKGDGNIDDFVARSPLNSYSSNQYSPQLIIE